jgi:hypothetical protein
VSLRTAKQKIERRKGSDTIEINEIGWVGVANSIQKKKKGGFRTGWGVITYGAATYIYRRFVKKVLTLKTDSLIFAMGGFC